MVQNEEADGRHGFAARLRQALISAGYPERGAAVRLASELRPKISERAVGKWLNLESMPDTKRLDQLAALLGVSVEWLLTGRSSTEQIPRTGDVHPSGSLPVGAKVPVIPFASVVVASADRTASPAMMAIDWIPCPVKHGIRTFAFRMPDDSMASNTSKSIPKGYFVWVDPDQCKVEHDKPVLARLDNGELVVAQYMEQAGRSWISLLNATYPPITIGFAIVGRVIFKGEET